jgi:hypothetical protein
MGRACNTDEKWNAWKVFVGKPEQKETTSKM